ncbi:MAG: SDR family oxidoreductase [Roseivirga sp.]
MKKSASKRDFIKKSLALGIGLPLVGTGLFSCTAEGDRKKAPVPLKILILGGTSFLGPHQIAYAVGRGHKVTTFTRGKTTPTVNKEAFEQVESLIGDRQDNLTALENREWDVVIDNSGRVAEWTKRTAGLLKDKVGMYLYISSTGVYYPHLEADVHEDTKVLLQDPPKEDGTAPERDSFGVMKAKSELEAIRAFGEDRTAIVRPTYMLGPADRTDRFMYWPLRLAKGGDIFVPGKADDPVQYIDVRDVAEWCIRLAENKTAGTFNAVGPQNAQGVLEFAQKASEAFDVESNIVLVEDYDFLQEQRVSFIIPWIMPKDDYYASARVQNKRAIQAGLSFREVKTTVKDTYDWWNSEAVDSERKARYEQNTRTVLAREQAILEAWQLAKS